MAVMRKTVTVLFADVADSTGIGERLDPESVRRALASWFDVARDVIERHGGTVEKFIGDAVMAVFGIPRVHEDDAVRAVRAADELRGALAALNDELERERGVRLAVRIGVNTGEVVTGDEGGTLVTGDAVNIAKRLEEAARSGEILVGSATEQLARAAATFELLEPLDLKGKTAPVEAWRTVSVDPDARPFERRFDVPLIGRLEEVARLRRAYERAVADRACERFTVLGAAGVGKSRLALELFGDVEGGATVVSGRCLPYGEGITFWPLHEVLRGLGGEEGVMRLLEANDDAELICARLEGDGASQETFWAVRRLCETLARAQPLVLCFEDVHWAEPMFLDLIEYLSGWIRDAPVFVVCLARPEFVDMRPTWVTGEERSESLTLKPLTLEESAQLLRLLGIRDTEGARIAEAAEGNPLYVEQMAAMVEEGAYADGMYTAPPTIQALLAARLDHLGESERAVVSCAAVAGKEFWRGAVAELVGDDGDRDLARHLMSLVRKDFIRPRSSTLLPDDAFRFSHVLVRDAVYDAIPKETRAVLHARLARWIERNAEALQGELEEILGYHLEQAYRYRAQLGPVDDEARALAERAGENLGVAGRRAFARDDVNAAVNLLDRAVALMTDEQPAAVELRRELGLALWSLGEVARAESLLEGVIDAAGVIGDRRLQWYSILDHASHRAMIEPGAGDEAARIAREALSVFQALDDDLGSAQAWREICSYQQEQGQFGAAAQSAKQALYHARRAGDRRLEARSADSLCTCLLYGPAPAPGAISVCLGLLDESAGKPLLEANVLASLVGLEAMQGAFEQAREQATRAATIYDDLGLRLADAGLRQITAAVEMLADQPAQAEQVLRPAFALLETVGAHAYTGVMLAESLYAQGRYEEAAELLASIEPALHGRDVAPQSLFRTLEARLAARAGDPDAVAVAASAVELASSSEALNLKADTVAGLADVLRLLGQVDEAAQHTREAVELYAAKGNVVAAQRTEALLSPSVR
jgi:class 3 adenylate cyclase/tetratricopeptide (TPR) repeat protein